MVSPFCPPFRDACRDLKPDLIALASGQPAWLAVTLLCAGSFVHVMGEMIGSGEVSAVAAPWPSASAICSRNWPRVLTT